MTDKPMDVKRTLLELETKWRESAREYERLAHVAKQRDPGQSEVTAGYLALMDERDDCADELKAVREALREPGAEAAPPTCIKCGSGAFHQLELCNECFAEFIRPERAAAGESTELRAMELAKDYYAEHQELSCDGDPCEKCQKFRALAASQERSATEEK
jgi:hypothetical protein